MPAFLSHSSADKAFVRAVAAELGPLEYELDEATFEYTLNVRAIRGALTRSDLVVFFVSRHSISSTFVSEEQRQSLESLGRGTIKKILIYCLDEVTYRELPDWLREINVVQSISNPKLCGRRISAALLEIDISDEPEMLYLGRDEDEAILRKALRVPAAETPIALHFIGFHGIGRRTFLRKTLNKLFPRIYNTFLLETVSQNRGIDDLYRSLYRLAKFTSRLERIDEFEKFANSPYEIKIAETSDLVASLAANGELIVIVDEGNGVFDDRGDYYDYWKDIISSLAHLRRPSIAFVQSRMQPFKIRHSYTLSFHQKLDGLNQEASREIIAFSLKQADKDYTNAELDQIADLSGGHPFNIRFAIGLASQYNVTSFLKDPSIFIAWRDRRGEEFLAEVAFSPLESEIVAVIIDYRIISAEALLAVLDSGLPETMEALRNLQDFCCIEFRDGMFHLASPIREAARRDRRFTRNSDWHKAVAASIIHQIEQYQSDDDVPLGLIESGTLAAVRDDAAPAYMRSLILPSHLLIVARELYDIGRWSQCLDLSKQAYSFKNSMTVDAKVDALRMWALSAARLGNAADNVREFDHAIEQLSSYHNPVAARVLAFIKGLKARFDGREDDAEAHFKDAHAVSPTNASVNRELAKLYLRQGAYTESETYAREAYRVSPTNPFVLDIMLDMLIGKRDQRLKVDEDEISSITMALEKYGNEPGYSFFSTRKAQVLINARQYADAVKEADNAINRTPDLPAPYFIKLEALLRQADKVREAEAVLKQVKELLVQKGLDGEGSSSVAEYEIKILVEKGSYVEAKSQLDRERRLARRVKHGLYKKLAKAISFDPQGSPAALLLWAKSF